MKYKYRLFLWIWISLLLFLLSQTLYTKVFLVTFKTSILMVYNITSYLWKFFLSFMSLSSMVLPLNNFILLRQQESPQANLSFKLDKQTKIIIFGVTLLLLVFGSLYYFLNNTTQYFILAWNCILFGVFVSTISGYCLFRMLKKSFETARKMDELTKINTTPKGKEQADEV